MQTTVKERLVSYINFKGIAVNRFEKICGLSTGYVRNMRVSIQPDKVSSIALNFSDLNTGWLLTGEGEMLRGNSVAKIELDAAAGKIIPLYDAEASAGQIGGMDMAAVSRPMAMIEIGSILADSEVALRVHGNSMVPNYPAGCILGLRPNRDSFIEPGRVYVVETMEERYLKRLHYNKDRSALRCISDNNMTYDDGPMKGEFCYPEFEIPFDEVRRLFRVVGVIKRNIL